jgi:hypothetical protein
MTVMITSPFQSVLPINRNLSFSNCRSLANRKKSHPPYILNHLSRLSLRRNSPTSRNRLAHKVCFNLHSIMVETIWLG